MLFYVLTVCRLQLDWEVTFTIPDKLPKGTVLKDKLSFQHNWASYFNAHEFTEAQRAALVSQLEAVFGTGAFDVELVTNSNGNQTYELVLTLKEDWVKPANMDDTVILSYSTTATADLSIVNPGISSSTDKDKFVNEFSIGNVSANAHFTYSKPVTKIDGTQEGKSGSKVTAHTVTRDNNTLKWSIVVKLDQDYNTLNLTDALPAGLTVTKVSIGTEYNQDDWKPTADGTFAADGYQQYIYQNVQSITANKTDAGTDVSISMVADGDHPRSNMFTDGQTLYITIEAEVDEEEFDSVATIRKTYTNNATVTANGNPYGEDYQTQNVTLDSRSVSKSLVKSAIGDLNTADDEWENYHYLSYGVLINEDGHTMNNHQPYSMEDVLSFNKLSPDGKEISFMLVPGSVKLQRKDNSGNWVNLETPENPDDAWKYQFIETKDGDMRYKTISVSNIPDDIPLRLVYTYQVEVNDPENGKSYSLGDIANTATIHGESDYSLTNHERKDWSEFSSEASTKSANSLTMSKVDLADYNKLLPGTKFVLEKWDGSKWVVVNAISQESIYKTTESDASKFGTSDYVIAGQSYNAGQSYTVYETASTENNKNGSLKFYMPTTAAQYTGDYFEPGVCYRAREYEAPAGGYYVESDPEKQPCAYFWFSKSADGNTVVDAANVQWPSYNSRIQNLADDLSVESDTFYITNAVRPSLKVTKKFQGDAELTEAQKKAMQFFIYWVGEDGTAHTSDDQLVKTLSYENILRNENVVTDLDSNLVRNGRKYYVVEKGIDLAGSEWTVTYSLNQGEEETALETTSEFSSSTMVSSGKVVTIENNVATVGFINKYDSLKTSLMVTKEWVDYHDKTVKNPSSETISFQIYQKKEGDSTGILYIPTNATEAQTYTVVFDSETKTWGTTEIDDLPKYYTDSNGSLKEYTYYVVETDPTEYLTATYKLNNGEYVEASSAAGNDGDKITIRNKEDEKLTVKKAWVDNKTTHNAISFHLYQRKAGTSTWEAVKKYQQLSAENDWTMSFEGLPAGYEYRVEETSDSIPYGYSVTYSTDGENWAGLGDTITITNTINPTGIAVHKVWDLPEGENPPESIEVQLMKADETESSDAVHVTYYLYTPQRGTGASHTIAVQPNTGITISHPGLNGNKTITEGTGSAQVTYSNNTNTFTITNASDGLEIGFEHSWYLTDVSILNVDYTSATSPDTSSGTPVTGKTATLQAPNWYAEWTGLIDGFYYVEETKVGDQIVSDTNYSVTYDNNSGIKTGTITITNTKEGPETGALKLSKLVTVSGEATTGTLADGSYTFTVASGSDITPAINKTVDITVTDGVAVSATVDGKAVELNSEGYVILTELPAGQYTITEKKPTNGTAISKINGQDSESYTATVTVQAGDTVAANASVVFTNNINKKDYEFTKEWHDNNDQPVTTWEIGKTIKVKVFKYLTSNKNKREEIGTYEITKTGNGFSITPNDGALLLTPKEGVNEFTFQMLNLDGYGTVNGESGDLGYFALENETVTGYMDPTYENLGIDGETYTSGGTEALNHGKIINRPEDSYALPSTGGPGTRLFTILGSILILGAGVALLWRRRRTT